MNLSVMEEEEPENEGEDGAAKLSSEQREAKFEAKMEVIYSKLISFKQFN